MPKGTVVLIAFYNIEELGIRYLESALTRAGWRVVTVLYKRNDGGHLQSTTKHELALLSEVLQREQPTLVGLSVLNSRYLDTVDIVLSVVQKQCNAVVCAGAYATMFPDRFLSHGAGFVICEDEETPIILLADALHERARIDRIPAICWMEGKKMRKNPIRKENRAIDTFGTSVINSPNACLIEDDTLCMGDPRHSTRSYGIMTSRGCRSGCSCCCADSHETIMRDNAETAHTRSVASVMWELRAAKSKIRKIEMVHFYDAVFPSAPDWVDAFCEKYPGEIGIPFSICLPPRRLEAKRLRKLIAAGLTEIIVCIQSGSPHIRCDVLHCYDTQEDIIEASRIIDEAGSLWAKYDFLVQHPLETTEDIRQSYELVKQMHGRFKLQLHGLGFLPVADILPVAIDQTSFGEQVRERTSGLATEKQFCAYWQRKGDPEYMLWYQMLYCLQFRSLRRRLERIESNPLAYREEIRKLYVYAQKSFHIRDYFRRAFTVTKSRS